MLPRLMLALLLAGLGAPVHQGDTPDPFVVVDGHRWLAFATNHGSQNVPVLVSRDRRTWKPAGDAMPRLARWAQAGASLTWAPSVLKRGSRWVLYYTARYRAAGLQAIGCAVADRPEGPYRDDSDAPFLFQEELGGCIDASPFVDDDGTAYLLWKSDGNCCDIPTALWIQRLSGDGRSLVGDPVRILERDQAWEQPLIEGPSLVKHDGVYHLFYSGGWWESDRYAIGHAVSRRVTGPYVKSAEEPLLASSGAVRGPGGQEVFRDADGLWIAFHAWRAPHVGYPHGARALHVERLGFQDGMPVIGRRARRE